MIDFQPWFYILCAAISGIIVGIVITGLLARLRLRNQKASFQAQYHLLEASCHEQSIQLDTLNHKLQHFQQANEQLRLDLATTQTQRDLIKEKLDKLEPAYHQLAEERLSLKVRIAELEKHQESLTAMIQWVDNARDILKELFDSLAAQTLRKNSEIFSRQAMEQMKVLLDRTRTDWDSHTMQFRHMVDPLRKALTELDTHIRDLEQKREGAYQGIQTQIENLVRTNSDLQTATIHLTQALKSPTERGRWGEVQLTRVVELAGMTEHVAFEKQVATDGGRPDMIIYLPNSGVIPVDAKAPLNAYLDAMESSTEELRNQKLAEHARAMRNQVRDLGRKMYWKQFPDSPGFVVMFVPNDACLAAAFETDPQLLEFAIGQKVMIATPITLIALLHTIALGWQQYQMTQNVNRIAELGQQFHKRIAVFLGHYKDLEKAIDQTVSVYNRSVGSLERRLMPIARKLSELGVATTDPASPNGVEKQPIPLSMDLES